MSRRQLSVVVFSCAIICLSCWWLLRGDYVASRSSGGTPGETRGVPITTPSSEIAALGHAHVDESADAETSRITLEKEILAEVNRPVHFFGRVIDQHGQAIPDVSVTMGVRTTAEVSPGKSSDITTDIVVITDTNGLFQLIDAKGSLLTVRDLEKSGYNRYSDTARSYWYYENEDARHRPDAASPEVFRMWKLAGPETLVHVNIATRIPYDGRAVLFDLKSGRQVETGGDIRVSLQRWPVKISRGQDRYDWTATVEAVDGGVIRSDGQAMYLAPEWGYDLKCVLSVSSNSADWSAYGEQFFYLKSGRTYSRVRVDFMTDSEKPLTGCNIEAFTNPSGSRNLEFDPLQDVVPSRRGQESTHPKG